MKPKKNARKDVQERAEISLLPGNIDGSAPTAGTFSRAFVSFLALIDTFQGPPDKWPKPPDTFP